MVDLYSFLPSFACFILRSIKLWILRTRIHSFRKILYTILGIQMVPQEGQDYDDYDSRDGKKPAFSFDNDTTMNLDGPGYALSLLLIGEIVILAMAFFAGGLGGVFGGRSFSSPFTVSEFSLVELTLKFPWPGVQTSDNKMCVVHG